MTEAEYDDSFVAELSSAVKQYRVCWEVLPKRLPDSMERRRIGFDIELWGRHNHPREAGDAECFDCGHVRAQLLRISEWLTPGRCRFRTGEGHASGFRMQTSIPEGYGRSLLIQIEVVCRTGPEALACACDGSCLKEMQDRLRSIGARQLHR